MQHRSLSRELSLITLGLIDDKKNDITLKKISIDETLALAVETLVNHCRSELDECHLYLESASQNLLESELKEIDSSFFEKTRDELKKSFSSIQSVMNILSDTLEFPKLIAMTDQTDFRKDIKNRLTYAISNISKIDSDVNSIMDNWRFHRLPRIDRDILRLAYVDINYMDTPVSVACNEAVNLANKYSDTQGRKMINGVLRRLQNLNVK